MDVNFRYAYWQKYMSLCVYMNVYIYPYIYTCRQAWICTNIQHMQVNMHICNVYAYTYIYVCLHTSINA